MSDIIQSFADVIPSHLRKEVERELIAGWKVQEAASYHQAKQFAAFNHANAAKSIEGVGELKARIPLSAVHYWGQRLGYDCWNDETFVSEFIRDNPEVAVNNRIKRTTVNGAIFTADGYLTK
jgi:hypothetical protein